MKSNALKIDLNEAEKIRKLLIRNDMLRNDFEVNTGLYTSL